VNVNPVPIVNVNPRQIPGPNEINDQYEISNELLGVRRDLFNKLGTRRWPQDDDLQQMYGISSGTIPWKNHFAFTMKRAQIPPK
jgi:hypothetical protein